MTFVFFESINKFLINKSSFVISVLPFLENFIRTRYDYKNSFYYLPNGTETNKTDVSKYPSIIKGNINVIYSGGFPPTAKIINVFRAIKILQKKNYHKIKFTFLGSGMDLNFCKKFVKENKIINIKFLRAIPKKNVYKKISNHHLCLAIVAKNKNQKFGFNLNKIYDYTSCGRPIIFTNNYRKNCFIEKNNIGFNCSPNPIDISKQIIKFYNMSHYQRLKMAKNSRIYAKKHFNIENLSKTYSKILYSENNLKYIKKLSIR